MPLSATTILPSGNVRLETLADVERSLESAQVAIVDADEPALEGKRALQFRLVVRLDQHVQAEVVRRFIQSPGGFVVDGRHDDEDAVRAPGPGLEHLVGIEQKVLAQDGQGVAFRALIRCSGDP